MKKIILSISCLIMSLSLFAQEAVEASEPEAATCPTVTFFDIVISSGIIGIGIWILIFSLTGVGFLLGISAIISSATAKSKQIPLSVKLMPVGLVFIFLLGLLGAITGAIDSFASLAPGAAKAQILALALSQSLYSLSFSLFGSIEYIIFFGIALIVLHFRHKKIMNKNS